jgi:hypothetical protein
MLSSFFNPVKNEKFATSPILPIIFPDIIISFLLLGERSFIIQEGVSLNGGSEEVE